MTPEVKAEIAAAVSGMGEQIAKQLTGGKTPDLAKAYVAFWGAVANVVKDAQNPHLKNNYASLEATMAVVKPALAANGLALLTIPGVVRDGNVTITTMLVHSSGQAWTFSTDIPLGEKIDKKTNLRKPAGPQEMGSCISYGRRYITQAISGMAAVDDDGEAASSVASDDEREEDTANAAGAISDLEARIGASTTVEGLQELKAAVSATGDKALVVKYLARREELKMALNKKKEK